MKSRSLPALLLPLYLFTASITAAPADKSPAAINKADPDPTATPTTQITPNPSPTPIKSTRSSKAAKALVIHKPMPSPSWGKVVQYHRSQILALSPDNIETLHEFLFQDEDGIVRTAVFHESSSGDGYWEVWTWDQQ